MMGMWCKSEYIPPMKKKVLERKYTPKEKKRHKKQVYRYNENFLRRGTIQIEIYDSISF